MNTNTNTQRRTREFIDTIFYTIENGDEVATNSWREATHALISCWAKDEKEKAEFLLEVGKWIAKREKQIADYAIYEADTLKPYIEIYKLKK